jgi:RNAse (barnase) inhibitor barstar
MSDTLLNNSDLAGIYSLPPMRRDAIEKSARRLHFKQRHLEIAPGQMAGAVLEQLGKTLHFPAWYGANFDALHDCLTDPECLPGKGHILTISGSNNLRTSDPDGFAILLDVFTAAADERRATAAPLWVLLDTPAPGIATLPAT